MEKKMMKSNGAGSRSSAMKRRRLLSAAAVLLICCLAFVGAAGADGVAQIERTEESFASIQAAVEAAAETASRVTGLIQKHIIARPTDDAQKMALRSSVGKERIGHIKNNA